TLGKLEGDESVAALARMAKADGADPWISAAILSARPDFAGKLFRALAADRTFNGRPFAEGFLSRLADIIGAQKNRDEIESVLAVAGGDRPRFGCLAAMLGA